MIVRVQDTLMQALPFNNVDGKTKKQSISLLCSSAAYVKLVTDENNKRYNLRNVRSWEMDAGTNASFHVSLAYVGQE